MATNGLTALITGGTAGIGRATANKLGQLGIHVLVVGRNPERGERRLRKSAPPAAKPTLFHRTCGMRRARARSREEPSRSEAATSISWSTMRESFRSARQRKLRKKRLIPCIR
jgi:NAD(P)-dependent dehydrogenase (short-subunit alcohol dehydrogenase family)